MKRLMLSLVLVGSFIPAVALACDGAGSHQAQAASPNKATVAQVAKWQKAKKVTPVDANGAETRATQGVIPGAVLLTSSSGYELSELPADKSQKLVFYCANTMCTASEAAAKRAVEAGYTNVAVLPEGIMGWKKAGQPTAKPNS